MIRNPLTVQIESCLGAFFILSTAIFFSTLIYGSAQNLNSESLVIESQRISIKTVSPAERALIDEWLRQKHIAIPEGKGYRYMKNKYPDRPWLD